MTRAVGRRYKKTLEAKREDLIREMLERRERLAVEPESDPMDQVRSVEDRDFAVHNVGRISGVLRLVEGALREIRGGTFGVCARCGDDIPVKRLNAVPWSPYCVFCQERAEQSSRDDEAPGIETPYAIAS
jgi:DnaK suppressor protein